MMISRFTDWQSTCGYIPRNIVFYRDGLVFDNKAVDAEMAAIKAAFKLQYEGETPVKITYVVINRNVRIEHVTLPAESDSSRIVMSTPEYEFGIGAEMNETEKLQNYVMHKDIGFT